MSKRFKYLYTNSLHGYSISKFLSISGLKWTDLKDFESDNSSTGCVVVVAIEYPKKLYELHDDYPLDPDKIKIKRKIMINLFFKKIRKVTIFFLNLGL